ncbi:MAG TPA: hypothetical protein VGD25_07415, partial [Immundisolibacter sp.]
MLALVITGRLWLHSRQGKNRYGPAKPTPGVVFDSPPRLRTARPAPDEDSMWSPPPRVEPTPDTVARPTEWTASLLRALEWKRFEEVCEG